MRAFLSLGSNLASRFGGRAETVLWGAQAIVAASQAGAFVCSGVYRTEPVGLNAQPDFANLVLEIETELEPHDLLRACHGVEQSAGRLRSVANGPRSLDVDILLIGQRIVCQTDLVVPHPRLHERRFVLVPLAEIAPEVHHPGLHKSACELLATVVDSTQVELWRSDRLECASAGEPEPYPDVRSRISC